MNSLLRLSALAVILGFLAGCTDLPPPQDAATGAAAAPPASERSLNAPYYIGSDPNFPRRNETPSRP